MSYTEILKELCQKNRVRVHHLPLNGESLVFLGVLFFTAWLMFSPTSEDGEVSAYGQYNPETDEIRININESHEMYNATVFHENKHQELFHLLPGFSPQLYISTVTMGVLISMLGVLTLRRDYWRYGVIMLIAPKWMAEWHAITFTFLKFQGGHSIWYFLYFPIIYLILNGLGNDLECLSEQADNSSIPAIYQIGAWRNAFREWKEVFVWTGANLKKAVKELT